MHDFHWSNAKYTNPSRATIPLIRPHTCDSDGGHIRGVLLYTHLVYKCLIMYDFHWSNAKYTNHSRETIPLIPATTPM